MKTKQPKKASRIRHTVQASACANVWISLHSAHEIWNLLSKRLIQDEVWKLNMMMFNHITERLFLNNVEIVWRRIFQTSSIRKLKTTNLVSLDSATFLLLLLLLLILIYSLRNSRTISKLAKFRWRISRKLNSEIEPTQASSSRLHVYISWLV